MSDEVTISTVIPVFDRELRLLRVAIDSVLAQTRPVDEILVVDDGSASPVAAALAEYGDVVRVVRQDNGGIGPARNLGVAQTSGDFLTFLDSDDIWEPKKTELQLNCFEADPDLDAVYGHARQFHDEETPAEFRARYEIATPVVAARLSGAQMIKRSSFARVGDFGDITVGVDVEWQLRARDIPLRETVLDDVVYHRRIHPGNIGIARRDEGNSARARMLHASLRRRRERAIAEPTGSSHPHRSN